MTIAELVTILQSRIQGCEVFASDLTGDGNHFEVVVVSGAFAGQSRVARQRLVLEAFSEEWKGALHALTMKTYTPEEWEKV
ncbi:MAG: BolA family transcriptional regulator [Bdellovibrionales bacterium]|nr:BolA family transcriptional regulator [Bdellovibrionales bacterium]